MSDYEALMQERHVKQKDAQKTCTSDNSSTISHVLIRFGLNHGPVYLILAYPLVLMEKLACEI